MQYNYPILLSIVLLVVTISLEDSFADSIKNAAKQRIGNYDIEMATDPINPVSHHPTKIQIRTASVDGQDLVDMPIVIRIDKEGSNVVKTNTILVPYGHYTYEYVFQDAGSFALYIDVIDLSNNGKIITFTFPLNVSNDYFINNNPLFLIVISIAFISLAIIVIRKIFSKRLGKINQPER